MKTWFVVSAKTPEAEKYRELVERFYNAEYATPLSRYYLTRFVPARYDIGGCE